MQSASPGLCRDPSHLVADPTMVRLPDDMAGIRVGFGFDVHRFDADRDRALFLGGVRFLAEPGLSAHSDGDVVCHAIADAMLGAVAAGDIGEHFPDTDPAVAGISGVELLSRTVDIVARSGMRPSGCDLTVLAERPAIAPHRDEMRRALAGALGIDVERFR